jgi:predicted alpha/beta-hydrolase family hydrolase
MTATRDLRFPVSDHQEVSALLLMPPAANCLLVLGHGAGAGMRHAFMNAIAEDLAAVGVGTFRYQFPYMEDHRRVPDRQPLLLATVAAAAKTAAKCAPELPLFASGKSMGGRMTSLAAAEGVLGGVRGLIFFGFPLHPPKQPSIKRAEHLKRVKVPMLFLQGTRDELAELTLLKPVCEEREALATLHIIEGADHSFHVLKKSGTTDELVRKQLSRVAADWCSRIG